MWATHLLSLFLIALFWIGLATPVTGWLCFLIVVSYANRVPLAMYGLDQVNGIAALYLAIAPCGARLSADAWIRCRLTMVDKNWRALEAVFVDQASPGFEIEGGIEGGEVVPGSGCG